MKFFNLTFLAFILVLSVGTFSFAALDDVETGTLVLGDSSGNGNTVDVPLSPGVTAGYTVGDWKGTNDWYVVGAYHSGGSKVFATASSISKMWEATGTADAKLVDTFATVPSTYDTAGSDAVWSDAGWDL